MIAIIIWPYNLLCGRIPQLLAVLSDRARPENGSAMTDDLTRKEIEIAAGKNTTENGVLQFGPLSPYSCPECHGVLSMLQNDQIIIYRCHTGHAYSGYSLLASITEKIEDGLYSALRGYWMSSYTFKSPG